MIVAFLGGHRAALFFVLMLLAGVSSWWWWGKSERLGNKISEMETTQLKVDLEYSTWKAEVEAARSLAVSESYDAYIKGKEDGKKEVVAIKSARDTGTLQLRDKFSCPSFTRDVSGAIPTAEGSHDENHTILSREDEEFLIHLAAEADDAIRLSNAKTEILTKERE